MLTVLRTQLRRVALSRCVLVLQPRHCLLYSDDAKDKSGKGSSCDVNTNKTGEETSKPKSCQSNQLKRGASLSSGSIKDCSSKLVKGTVHAESNEKSAKSGDDCREPIKKKEECTGTDKKTTTTTTTTKQSTCASDKQKITTGSKQGKPCVGADSSSLKDSVNDKEKAIIKCGVKESASRENEAKGSTGSCKTSKKKDAEIPAKSCEKPKDSSTKSKECDVGMEKDTKKPSVDSCKNIKKSDIFCQVSQDSKTAKKSAGTSTGSDSKKSKKSKSDCKKHDAKDSAKSTGKKKSKSSKKSKDSKTKGALCNDLAKKKESQETPVCETKGKTDLSKKTEGQESTRRDEQKGKLGDEKPKSDTCDKLSKGMEAKQPKAPAVKAPACDAVNKNAVQPEKPKQKKAGLTCADDKDDKKTKDSSTSTTCSTSLKATEKRECSVDDKKAKPVCSKNTDEKGNEKVKLNKLQSACQVPVQKAKTVKRGGGGNPCTAAAMPCIKQSETKICPEKAVEAKETCSVGQSVCSATECHRPPDCENASKLQDKCKSDAKKHSAKASNYRNLSLSAVGLILGLTGYVFYFMQHHPRQEFVAYDYLRLRNKRFPWGDGTKTYFHNPKINALPGGYEDDICVKEPSDLD